MNKASATYSPCYPPCALDVLCRCILIEIDGSKTARVSAAGWIFSFLRVYPLQRKTERLRTRRELLGF